MNKTLILGASLAAVAFTLALVASPPARGEEEQPAGEALFLEAKCNLCHSVPAAGIEAKTKSEKMRGPELVGPIDADAETVAAYLRKEGELNGETHKKKVDISTEDVQTILDWLGSLEAAE